MGRKPDPSDIRRRAAAKLKAQSKALTVSPEKLTKASKAIYELRVTNASSHDIARAAALALGLKVEG